MRITKNTFLLNRFILFKQCTLLEGVVIILYCVRMFAAAWLAFDYPNHPIFQFVVSWLGKFAIVFAVIYLLGEQKHIKASNARLSILPLIYTGLIVFRSEDLSYFTSNAVIILSIIIFILLDDRVKEQIVVLFYTLVLVSIFVSIIAYILVVLNLASNVVSYYGASTSNYYYQFGPLAILNSEGLYRMCGPFNEGGNLGTTCAFLYAIFDKKNTIQEKVLLIIGIVLSFSLAGWILLLLYWTCDLITKKKFKGIFPLAFLLAAFLLLPYIDFGNEQINTFAQRFAISSEGLKGDNRTWYGFDEQYDSIVNSPLKWWGAGTGFERADSSTYKSYIIMFGYLGTALLAIPWLIACMKRSKKNIQGFLFVFIFFVSLYQRPAPLVSLFGYMIMFGGLEYIGDRYYEWIENDKDLYMNIAGKRGRIVGKNSSSDSWI